MGALRVRVRQYVRTSLWPTPMLGGVAGAVLGSIACPDRREDRRAGCGNLTNSA